MCNIFSDYLDNNFNRGYFFQIRPYLQTYQPRAYNSNPKCGWGGWGRWWRDKRSVIAPWPRSNYDDASDAFNVSFITLINAT